MSRAKNNHRILDATPHYQFLWRIILKIKYYFFFLMHYGFLKSIILKSLHKNIQKRFQKESKKLSFLCNYSL